jgi:signal peptidase I
MSDLEQLSETEITSETAVTEAKAQSIISRFFSAKRGVSTSETVMYYVRESLAWILIFLVAFFVAMLINMYVVRFSNVVGDSMLQTYHDGDRVVLSKLPYIFSEPKRGDVIVFDSKKEKRNFFEEFAESCKFNMLTQLFMSDAQKEELSNKYYIKRIIAIEGDTIEFKDNKVWVNGEALKEDYVNPAMEPNYTLWEGRSWTLGKGEIFVMGDNRNCSEDSRSERVGVVPVGCILGKVVK